MYRGRPTSAEVSKSGRTNHPLQRHGTRLHDIDRSLLRMGSAESRDDYRFEQLHDRMAVMNRVLEDSLAEVGRKLDTIVDLLQDNKK